MISFVQLNTLHLIFMKCHTDNLVCLPPIGMRSTWVLLTCHTIKEIPDRVTGKERGEGIRRDEAVSVEEGEVVQEVSHSMGQMMDTRG